MISQYISISIWKYWLSSWRTWEFFSGTFIRFEWQLSNISWYLTVVWRPSVFLSFYFCLHSSLNRFQSLGSSFISSPSLYLSSSFFCLLVLLSPSIYINIYIFLPHQSLSLCFWVTCWREEMFPASEAVNPDNVTVLYWEKEKLWGRKVKQEQVDREEKVHQNEKMYKDTQRRGRSPSKLSSFPLSLAVIAVVTVNKQALSEMCLSGPFTFLFLLSML